jgi:hypothetical protein
MIHLGVRGYFFMAGSTANRIRRPALEQQLALPCKISGSIEHGNTWMEFAGLCPAANLATRESKCRRNTIRP